MTKTSVNLDGTSYPVYRLHTLIVGSGAASLKAADRLHQYGITDIAIVTDNLQGGTSRNTGSDKQTYYKLSMSTPEPDSPYAMADALYRGGSSHGDIALTEATGSPEAFYHLVNIGVPFPHNRYGGYTGYKTDHDPLQRGTSIGPFTSRVMVERLLDEVTRREVPIFDRHHVVSLLSDGGRVYGALALDENRAGTPDTGFTLFLAENVVFGTGGPGKLYRDSVYPEEHTGGIGLALEAGAEAYNLQESQFGLASITHRWNVSGSYQQVVPRYISTARGGREEREFLREYFPSVAAMCTAIFLKGYQWPFDAGRINDYGSSLIDIIVYNETVIKGRRVFLDFRTNPSGFVPSEAEPTVYEYLQKSDALQKLPIQRLEGMNPAALEHYREHGIDLHSEPLEIAVCAQHNNGGLAVDTWWESTSISRLFPVGEVAGTHGVKRPGGSALNAGQVGAARAAQRIAFSYGEGGTGKRESREQQALSVGAKTLRRFIGLAAKLRDGKGSIEPAAYRREIQERMTRCAALIRDPELIESAIEAARRRKTDFEEQKISSFAELPFLMQNRHLRIAERAYLDALNYYIRRDGGSRGSYLVLDPGGENILDKLGEKWKYKPENMDLREYIVVTKLDNEGRTESRLEQRRPVPTEEFWFERVWREYRSGSVFRAGEENEDE